MVNFEGFPLNCAIVWVGNIMTPDSGTASLLPQGFAKSKDPLAAKNLYREMRSERVPFGFPGFNG